MRKKPENTAKTRQKIVDAFWEVYKNIRNEKVTVGSIMKAAGMNRGTFYEYFKDIYDLLEQEEDALLEKIKKNLDQKVSCERQTDVGKLSMEITSEVLQHGDKVYFLLCRGDRAFYEKLQDILQNHIINVLGLPEAREDTEYLFAYIMSGINGIIVHWHESGKKMKIEEVVKMVGTLPIAGVQGYLKMRGEKPF